MAFVNNILLQNKRVHKPKRKVIKPETDKDETKKCCGCCAKTTTELLEEEKYRNSQVFWEKLSNSRLCPSEP